MVDLEVCFILLFEMFYEVCDICIIFAKSHENFQYGGRHPRLAGCVYFILLFEMFYKFQ